MTTGGKQEPGSSDAGRPGASEPITLTDPDGAVTRVDPWSSWTREQVRAPGGEPALVTRLEQGQLWFAAGRKRSPWRHEVKVGPATVSTPRGRFHVIAEPDGGATVACLAGRTRVVTGLREPVLLGPDQSAAVSSDGATLVVMDRSKGEAPPESGDAGEQVLGLPQAWAGSGVERWRVAPAAVAKGVEAALEAEMAAATAEGSGRRADDVPAPAPVAEATTESAEPEAPVPSASGGSGTGGDGGGDGGGDPEEPEVGPGPGRSAWTRIPEVVAVAALIAVLVAAIVVFTRTPESGEVADVPLRSTTTTAVRTTAVPGTVDSTPPTVPTTAAPTSSTPPTTTSPPTLSAPGTGTGVLVACRRAEGGVRATVKVLHRSGGPDRFTVRVGLVDRAGLVFAQRQGTTGEIGPGGSAALDVLVPVSGRAAGACEVLGVVAA